ncbi:MAG: methyltransferase domain-containing protein [Planctomycetaceae bacterium]
MNESLLALLRCPGTGDPLTLSDDGLALTSREGSSTFPIIGGIPRFTQSEHLSSFGRQWTRYEVAHDDEDRATFQAKTGLTLGELAGLRILDAGCGGGRYAKVAGEAGATVIGVDHTEAVEKAASLCALLPNVQFVQADLKRLPFEPQSFDAAFSVGVMHHDADTRRVFDAVAPMVKPGGRLSVWLYRRNQWWQERLNDRLRRRTTSMCPERLERWCRWGAALGGVPILNKTLNKVVSFSNHPCFENRLCDTFDWYAPQFQHHHTTDELTEWFRAAGFREINVLPPERSGRLYRWVYERSLLVGSGVNVTGVRANQ